jgi:membrane-associated phospholipid phosphatase
VRIGAIILLALGLGAPLAFADEAAEETTAPPPRRTFRESFHTFVQDGGYLVTFPARATARGAWMTAGVVAATALAMNRDEEIRDNILGSDRPGADRIASLFEPLGRLEVQAAALGTLYLAGRGTRNGRVVATAATAFEAYLWAAIITSVAKAAFGREQPGEGSGEGEFFAGDTIFPSGHTTRSFAIAAVFADHGGRTAAWIAYPIATLVGLSTIQEDKHWTSDVVAGAGLGLAIGKGIAGRHPLPREGRVPASSWTVIPRAGGAAVRIGF